MSDAGDPWPGGRARDGGIDPVPLPDGRGEVWLCGKHAIGPNVHAALARTTATTVVCLTERHELLERYPDYVAWLLEQQQAGAAPDRAIWFPISDLHAPSLERVVPLLTDLRTRLDNGERLLVHCAAGFGRTGTVVICLLVALGMNAATASALVASCRPMAGPEVGAQRDLVAAVAALFAQPS